MKRLLYLLLVTVVFSCGRKASEQGGKIITVSIPPFKYFVEEIVGGNFKVNIVLPS
jgi:ABC-type Zn uptake system ZnuABC Zn-binding protein ZnuA